LLREQQAARASNRAGYLFPTSSGLPFDAHTFMGRYFKPAARAAGIPELTFHDLRHTGASLMIAAGCHVKVIAAQALETHIRGTLGDRGVGSMLDGRQLGLELE
ncbi:MAG: tyrosine-type recombinase/integrase, partial [Actinobacteria bacterium]|nr:tyrosine-type recombinase/integrase [Actinomycetota bacterium]